MTTRRCLIVYYSRTGTTRRVVEALSRELDCDVEEIVESRSRLGMIGYIRSAFEARRQRLVAIEASKCDPSAYDLVVVGTPVWAWSLSSPVRAWLNATRGRLPDVAIFCTLGGAGDARVLGQMRDIIGKSPRAGLVVTARDMSSGDYREQVLTFAKALRQSPVPRDASPPLAHAA
jgi:menaquinone-dependent protoporphyrinogen IX oxidase